MERGFVVHAISPKHLDRFRDRFLVRRVRRIAEMRGFWRPRCGRTRMACDVWNPSTLRSFELRGEDKLAIAGRKRRRRSVSAGGCWSSELRWRHVGACRSGRGATHSAGRRPGLMRHGIGWSETWRVNPPT